MWRINHRTIFSPPRVSWRRFGLLGAVAAVLAFASATPASAAAGPVLASHGDPFAACIGVGADPAAGGMNYPNAEVEPFISDNPASTRNLVSAWQQDRWSDGGAKGLVAGWSDDGGRSWHDSVLPFSACAAPFATQVAPFDRASDPWVSFGPDGKVYAQALVFNANDNHNGVASATSVDGGRTWQNLRLVIDDPASDPTLPVNDKNSVTADPRIPGLAYAVWDRSSIVPCGAARTASHVKLLERKPTLHRSAPAAPVCTVGPTVFSRTTDGGLTWSAPRVIVPVPVNAQTIGNVVVVNQQTGTLFDFYDFIDANGDLHAEQAFSLDHGVTWSQPQSVADILSAANGLVRAGVVDPRNPNVSLRTGDILPEPAIDPVTGRLYLAWQDARFNGGANDQVVISTSTDPLGRTGTWTAPTLVSPKGDPAAFNPAVAVNHQGQVAVLFQDFRHIDSAPAAVLPTDTWVRVAAGPSFDFDSETRVSPTFNMLAAPQAGGFFVGDYNSITASPKTGGFTAVWGSTDCADTSCTAIANPTGAPTGGPDPTDAFTHRVPAGEDGNSQR